MKLIVVIIQLTFMWLGFAAIKLAVNLVTHLHAPSSLLHGDKMAHHFNIGVMVALNLLTLYGYMRFFNSAFSVAKVHHTRPHALSVTYYLLIGSYWAMLSALFQFGYAKYVLQFSWDVILHEYELHRGRFWSLVLVLQIVAPLSIAYFMYSRSEDAARAEHTVELVDAKDE